MKNALVISGISWSDTYQRHHVVTEYLLDNGYSVDFLEGVKSSKLSFQKLKSVISRKLSPAKYSKNTRYSSSNLNIISTFNFPSDNYITNLINSLSSYSLLKRLKKEYELVIVYVPSFFVMDLLSRVSHNKLLYDCVRNFEQWAGIHESIVDHELELLDKSDLILTDSYYLTDKWKKYNPFQVLPTVEKKFICSEEGISSTGNEIRKLGFFGTLSEHFDISTISAVLDAGYTLHFWGVNEINYDHKNFVNHGFEKNITALMKSISCNCDAIVIPYKGCMDGVIPAKMMQCMALGIPVFCSYFYDSNVLSDRINVFQTSKELLEYLNLDSVQLKNKLRKSRDFCLDNTSDKLTAKLNEVFN